MRPLTPFALIAAAASACSFNATLSDFPCGVNADCPSGQQCISSRCEPTDGGPGQIASAIDCVSAVATGFEHSCAIRSDGTAWCWGSNEFGQLGNASNADQTQPVQVNTLTGVKAIAGGQHHTCAIDGSGALWCWGQNIFGQLGNSSTDNSAVPAKVTGLTGIAGHAATQIAAGDNHSCALLDDQSVWCWGADGDRQLGDGMANSQSSPAQVMGFGKAMAIAAGGSSTCAIDTSSALWCWGNNDSGQLGSGMASDFIAAPTKISSGITAVSVGELTSCALTSAGAVMCAGDNGPGALGTQVNTNSVATPVQAALPVAMTSISVGDHFACATAVDSTVWCWGNNADTQFGIETFNPVFPTHVGYAGTKSVATGDGHVCVLTRTGGIACSGRNNHGQLGDGHRTTQPTPQAVPGVKGIVSIAAGNAHTCAALADSSTVCWGDNSVGQSGDQSTNFHETPGPVQGVIGATQIVAGAGHTCALLPDHTVKCWGVNQHGALGDGSGDTHGIARLVIDTNNNVVGNVSQITAGGEHSCAVIGNAASGSPALCWGEDNLGQLGDLPFNTGANPSLVAKAATTLGLATALAAGSRDTCVLDPSHRVVCYGDAGLGELGTGSNPTAYMPVNLSNVDQISAFDVGTCAHLTNGSVDCWGDIILGNGQPFGSNTPVMAAPSGAAKVVLGGSAACLLTSASSAGGPIRCWGDNHTGAVGTGDYDDRLQPVLINGLDNVIDMAAGESHMCAVLADRTAVCWGDNSSGQLGTGEIAVQAPIVPMLTCPKM